MNEDSIWADDETNSQASTDPSFADAGAELAGSRSAEDAKTAFVASAALRGFLTGGLTGLVEAVDLAEGETPDEDVDDPEALRRAEDAVRGWESPFDNHPVTDKTAAPGDGQGGSVSHEVDPAIEPYVARSVVAPVTPPSLEPFGGPDTKDPNLSDNARLQRLAGGGVSTGGAILIIAGFLVLMAVLYVVLRP